MPARDISRPARGRTIGRRTVGVLLLLTIALVAAAIGLWLVRRANHTGTAGGTPSSDTGQVAVGHQWLPLSEQSFAHGRFEHFTVYRPHDPPRGFVLLLSAADGWNAQMIETARRMAAQGAMVTGIDTAQLASNLAGDPAQCVFPDGDLENLSRFVQAFYRLSAYLPPILSGFSAGGTLAYAVLAQSPPGSFGGALSIDFCPTFPSAKRLCKSGSLDYVPHAADVGVDLLPSKDLKAPWIALQRSSDGACTGANAQSSIARSFIAAVPGARWVTVSSIAWDRSYGEALDSLITRNAPSPDSIAPTSLNDLPLVTVAVPTGTASTDSFAIMLSGDGGWAGLDKEVAAALAEQGIAVIGLDSLRYFWGARTPQGIANDLARIFRYYSRAFGKQHVVLVGYSQGADVLPFAVNRLTPEDRSHVVLTAIMGMSEHALFEFHMTSWLGDDNSGPPTLPEVERIRGVPVLCIYGEDEDDSLCPKLDPRVVGLVKLKGGHHFDGNYSALADAITGAIKPRTDRSE